MRIVTALLAGVLGWVIFAGSAHAVTLRAQTRVEGDIVHLSDVFADLPGTIADAEIARAPAPGARLVLDVTQLQGIAASNGVSWTPASRLDRVTIERAAAYVGTDKLRPLILAALRQRGADADIDIVFDNEGARLAVPESTPDQITIDLSSFDATRGRFQATATSDGNTKVQLSGRVYGTAQAAVPVRPIQSGEKIQARDLQWTRQRVDLLARGTATEPDRLVGRVARRYLAPGQIVRQADIELPLLVHRNHLVTLAVNSSRMSISMQAKALDDGAEGDVVRVQNPRSNKIVQGVVTATGEVVVTTGGGVAAGAVR